MALTKLIPAALILAFTLALAAGAQTPQAGKPAAGKPIPRTRDGHPDFQGVWLNNSATPFERPKTVQGRDRLTDQEVADMSARAKKIFTSGGSDAASADEYFNAAFSNVEKYKSAGATDSSERVLPLIFDNRTSLITDPPEGRMPALTEAGQRRRAAYGRARGGRSNPASPREVAPGDRCITFGVPRLNGVYSAGLYGYFQVVQTEDHFLFFAEAIHDVRIFPLNGLPKPPAEVRGWSGYSGTHWDKDTLVVDTTNFNAELNSYGFSPNFHLTERFTLVSPDEITYDMTFDDADTWVRPWSAMIRFRRSAEALHEFACHEGNEFIMQTILKGEPEPARPDRQ